MTFFGKISQKENVWQYTCRAAVFGTLVIWIFSIHYSYSFLIGDIDLPRREGVFSAIQNMPVLMILSYTLPILTGLSILIVPTRFLVILHGVLLEVSLLSLIMNDAVLNLDYIVIFWTGIIIIKLGIGFPEGETQLSALPEEFADWAQTLIYFFFLIELSQALPKYIFNDSAEINRLTSKSFANSVLLAIDCESLIIWTSTVSIAGYAFLVLIDLFPSRNALLFTIVSLGGLIFLMEYSALGALGLFIYLVAAAWYAQQRTSMAFTPPSK